MSYIELKNHFKDKSPLLVITSIIPSIMWGDKDVEDFHHYKDDAGMLTLEVGHIVITLISHGIILKSNHCSW
jgi:hypothetical protein